jgi:hypothetical protein
MGIEHGGVNTFNAAETAFIETLEANLEETEASNLHTILSLDRDQMVNRAHELMDVLDVYKVDRTRASQRIKRGWEIMDDFIAGKAEYLEENALTPIVFGSITYDDPAHFDFDLCLVGMNEIKGEKGVQRKWMRDLHAVWKEVGVEGNLDFMSFEMLEKCAQAFQDNKVRYIDKVAAGRFFDFLPASSILIGEYPYSPPEDKEKYKEMFLDILKQSHSLFAYTISNLERSVIERETRRAGVGDHQTGEDKFRQRLVAQRFGIQLPPNFKLE